MDHCGIELNMRALEVWIHSQISASLRGLEALLTSTGLQCDRGLHNLQKSAKTSLVFSRKHLRSAVVSFESYAKSVANTEPHLCATVWMNICLLKVFILSSFTHCTSLQSWINWNKILYIWRIFVWLVFFPCSCLNVYNHKQGRAVTRILEMMRSRV